MPNDKLILLIQAKVLPEHRAEFLQALRETLPLIAFEHGIDAREALWNSNAYQRP